ncbi:hypothetical protein RCG23_25700 [Neobacillus sp. PS3-34]|uniref:hypothetical protein n=1 Tax=Neobacillus sp. PS3-34 TaxID=3070678 RepID=UPI0027DFFFF6|nr:hypothetical protein [Neobacillus sp. PS3-34]WML48571.1 hypothetical protein RCG23_25700 [Neobacillus sp. PS3-34]
MFDLKKIWTCDGFLVDDNGDSVPDGVRVKVDGVKENCMPVGLIDFYARLGLETTALSFPFIKNATSESRVVQISIDANLGNTGFVQADHNKVIIQGGNEGTVNDLLRWLASSWPHGLPEEWERKQISRIEWMDQKYRVNTFDKLQSKWIAVPPQMITRAHAATLGGLQNLWTVQGFFQGGEWT